MAFQGLTLVEHEESESSDENEEEEEEEGEKEVEEEKEIDSTDDEIQFKTAVQEGEVMKKVGGSAKKKLV